eukprot:5984578-Amphidinium_carterae.2
MDIDARTCFVSNADEFLYRPTAILLSRPLRHALWESKALHGASMVRLCMQGQMLTIVSAHLPHAAQGAKAYQAALLALSTDFACLPHKSFILGVDANVALGSHSSSDPMLYGHSFDNDSRTPTRGAMFLSWCASLGFNIASSWSEVPLAPSHRPFNAKLHNAVPKTLDYVCCSAELVCCQPTHIDSHYDRTDHSAVTVGLPFVPPDECPRRFHWRPHRSHADHWNGLLTYHSDTPDFAISMFAEAAASKPYQARRPQHYEDKHLEVLRDLEADPLKRWELTKQLWRSRRQSKRQRSKLALLQDLRVGRRPKVVPRSPATLVSQGFTLRGHAAMDVHHDFWTYLESA